MKNLKFTILFLNFFVAGSALAITQAIELRLTNGAAPLANTTITVTIQPQTSGATNCGTSTVLASVTTDVDGIYLAEFSVSPVGTGSCVVSQYSVIVYDGVSTVNLTVDAGLASTATTLTGITNANLMKIDSAYSAVNHTYTDAIFQKLKAMVDGSTFTGSSGSYIYHPPAGGGTVTSVSSVNSDIGVGNGAGAAILTLNSGTSPNQILKLDGAGKIPAVDGSQLTSVSVFVDSVTSGTSKYLTYRPNGTSCSTNESLKFDGTRWVCGAQVPSFVGITASQLVINNGSSYGGIIQTSTNLPSAVVSRDATGKSGFASIEIGTTGVTTLSRPSGSNYNLNLPITQGSNGQTLINDGSGNLSWTNASGPKIFKDSAVHSSGDSINYSATGFSGTPVCVCTVHNSVTCYFGAADANTIVIYFVGGGTYQVSTLCIQ